MEETRATSEAMNKNRKTFSRRHSEKPSSPCKFKRMRVGIKISLKRLEYAVNGHLLEIREREGGRKGERIGTAEK